MAAVELAARLVDLGQGRFSGLLELRHGRVTQRISWAEGLLTSADSDRPRERLSAFLVEKGYVAPEAGARLEQGWRSDGRSELSRALELRLLSPLELLGAVHEHLRSCLVHAFGWPAIDLQLRPAARPVSASPHAGIDPLPVVQEGIENHWNPDRILQSLGAKTLRYAWAAPAARRVARRLRGSEELGLLLRSLDGHRTLGECLHGAGSLSAFAAAWLLDAVGALCYSDAPHREAAGQAPELEIVVAGPALDPGGEPGRDGPELRAGEREHAAAALRAELDGLHAAIDQRSHYELLGVERSVDLPGIRQAYKRVARRLHPDVLARLGLDDLKDRANQVFSRIALAHATLSDPARRREYDAAASGGGGPESERRNRARTLHRKASVLLRAGRFHDALPLLESCVALHPEESAYQSDLGWALFKRTQPRLPQARAALEQAVRLAPSEALPLLRLSLVLVALGEREKAIEVRARAHSLDPSLRGR